MTERPPKHVAIIMDGNGRWAEKRGLSRVQGHEEGGHRIEEILRAAPDLGIQYLTLYAFSKENWQRPRPEVSALMKLLSEYLDKKLGELLKHNVRFKAIGRIGDLPAAIQKKIARNIEMSKGNTGLTATFAFSYSSRLEITDACQRIAAKAARGKLDPQEITEQTVEEHLYTHGLPDPDLVIRTSGEMRISNFLLWQISYAELYVTDKYWPEFNREELVKAIDEFQKRERRFGRTPEKMKNV